MLNVCVCIVPLSQPSSRDLSLSSPGCSVPEKKSIKKKKVRTKLGNIRDRKGDDG